MRAFTCIALCMALALGCSRAPLSEDPGSSWLELARRSLPAREPPGVVELAGGVRAGLVREAENEWLVAEVSRAAWKPAEKRDGWHADLPAQAAGRPRGGAAPYRLECADADGEQTRSFHYVPLLRDLLLEKEGFTNFGNQLVLRLAEHAEPPARCRLFACANYQTEQDGRARVTGRRLSGDGFWIAPGRAQELVLELGAPSTLRFATAVEELSGTRATGASRHVFRARVDGRVVLETQQDGGEEGTLAWHELALEAHAARVAFEVEGPFALTSILGPIVRPRAIGRPGARPWPGSRADLIVFLADTFRADNLGAYGSSSGLTPELDRFAAHARVFARAWSTSTHTLPAHSSIFSGVYPPQNGQVGFFNPLPAEVLTLAELLRDHGYRCGAISDGVMVSHTHGLDQGFEIFDERARDGTLERARAFLDADDGRPQFLFVQTYLVHTPYEPRPETRRRLSGRLELDASFAPLLHELEAHAWKPGEAPPEVAHAIARAMRQLYLAEVSELDGLFAAFRAELETRGLLGSANFVFTSDHGEAFLEHDEAFHAGRVFEEQLRVPLLLTGPLIAPGREERPVSLIDLAPTLAGLAGLASEPHWQGRSLLALPAERPLYAFQAFYGAAGSSLAVIDAGHKLIGREDPEAIRAGRFDAAFDLGVDPLERDNVLTSAPWPAELERARRAELLELLRPLVTPEAASLSADEAQAMQAMGYAGEEK